jgi:hypothetical protein
MKKSKTKSSARRPRVPSATRKPDLAAVRENIAGLVGARAMGMVEATIEEADKGHYAAMKYLFEMVGLYPAGSVDASQEGGDVLAKTLLRRLSLPEEGEFNPNVTKGTEDTAGADEGSKSDAVE